MMTLSALLQRRLAVLMGLAGLLPALFGACGGPASPLSSSTASPPAAPSGSSLQLSSPAFADGGALPAKYTCKSQSGLGVETNPPLAWSSPPAGTVGYVLLASTVANEAGVQTTKYNWVLYNIPSNASAIPEDNTVITTGNSGSTQVGTPGLTSDGPQFSYSPPCSPKGSGLRTYTFTLYALSASPVFTPNRAPGGGGDGANLAAALPGITIGKASITASYAF
jgi:hypothetical protein